VTVREIGVEGIPDFCRVMVAAYYMPEEAVSILTTISGISMTCPAFTNYVAYVNGEPVGALACFRIWVMVRSARWACCRRAPFRRSVCAGRTRLSGLEEGWQQSDGLSDRAAQDGTHVAHCWL